MKNLFNLLLITLIMVSCVNDYKYEGFLHPSNPKLHNIQVIKNDIGYGDKVIYINYYSFTDSSYHRCQIPMIFKLDFTDGVIIK